MKKIVQILKKSLLPIIIVIALLFLQAACDLALPDYTSKIINIGIQQNGIEKNIYEVIRKSEMDKLLIFTDKDEEILNNYKLITNKDTSYLDKYPLLEKENLYILKNDTKLKEELKTPMLMIYFFTNKNMNSKILKEMSISAESDIFEILKNMPYDNILTLEENITQKTSELTPTMINQMTINLIKDEYKTIGLKTESIQINYIASLGIKMLLLSLLIMVITITTTYLSSKIGASFSKDLRSKVVNKVMSYSNKEFESLSTSSLITRSTNDITQIQTLLTTILRIVIYAPILGFGALSKVSNSPLEWIIGVAVLTILSLVIILFSVALPKFKKLQKLVDKINLIAREILTGLPVIRAFATEKHEEKKFDEANKDLTKTNLFVNRLMVFMMPAMMFIMYAVEILIVWVGSKYVDLGNVQVGDLFAFISYTMQIIMSFLMIAMVSIILPRAWVSVKRISEVFNKDTSVKDSLKPIKFKNNIDTTVEFKDVYFRYPDALEDVLENISFKATKGTTTAFIGSTGSGKSTLINLIPRFYDVTGGKVLINNVDIKNLSLKSLRSKIGFVPQNGILFSGTIESNIMFGKKLTPEELKKVSKIAQADKFIEEKEDKYKAIISQGGTNVSGGQKQRLAIARAIAFNPKIYVFDDSFSALDYKTDSNLRKMLKKEMKDSIIFIVAQRINTILNADQIIVLDEGKIVGIGNHRELLNNCKVYKEIALSQLSKEELNNE